jgi:hypothetical protein
MQAVACGIFWVFSFAYGFKMYFESFYISASFSKVIILISSAEEEY